MENGLNLVSGFLFITAVSVMNHRYQLWNRVSQIKLHFYFVMQKCKTYFILKIQYYK